MRLYTITSGYGSNIYSGDPVFISGGVEWFCEPYMYQQLLAKARWILYGRNLDKSRWLCSQNKLLGHQVKFQQSNIVASVSDNPFSRFKVQLNGAYSDSYLGQLADFVVGAGNTVSGSGYALDVATVGTGTGFLITDVFASPNNADSAYAIVEVVPMKQIYRS